MNEPNDDDFIFDAAGWWRNNLLRRYELHFKDEVIAVVSFDEVRLAKTVEGYDLNDIITAAAELYEKRLLSALPP